MSARAIGITIALVLALSAVGSTALFWIQNQARMVMLSLNFGFVRLALAEPLPVPVLMSICLGAGFLLGIICVLALRMGGGRRRKSSPYAYDDRYESSPDRV